MRSSVVLAAALVAALAVAAAVAQDPSPPKWPTKYLMQGSFQIPYFNITEPLRIVYDGVNQMQRIDWYHGMDLFIYRPDKNFEVVPRVTTVTCFTSGGSPTGADLVSVLPLDIAQYTFVGMIVVHGGPVSHWQKKVTNLGRVSTYDMFVDANGNPLKLTMDGYNFVFGSHPDQYIIEFDLFVPNYADQTEFNPPSQCSGSNVAAVPESQTRRNAQSLRAMMHGDAANDAELSFQHHVRRFGKTYKNAAEHAHRRSVYAKNLDMITKHNAKNPDFKLHTNQFTDLEHSEFRSRMMPKLKRQLDSRASWTIPVPTPEQLRDLPPSIDWRDKGAVAMVKDQGACGSCWTFGTAGSLEGAYAIKHNQLIMLSEQQIVDCAWGYMGNSGCDGGFASGAMQWIMDNGGMSTEAAYPYLAQDSFCRAKDHSAPVQITSYVNVTSGSEAALQYAVANFGPVAIAIDAAHPEFEFYSSGVYYNPACKNTLDALDHEVLCVGYGTDDQGNDYWIVKNSWSTHWGDNGFIKMARNRGNNCGISTQANYANVA